MSKIGKQNDSSNLTTYVLSFQLPWSEICICQRTNIKEDWEINNNDFKNPSVVEILYENKYK